MRHVPRPLLVRREMDHAAGSVGIEHREQSGGLQAERAPHWSSTRGWFRRSASIRASIAAMSLEPCSERSLIEARE
jgi:hypothetical protein